MPARRQASNGLPVIDRVSAMLALLERQPAGATIRELTNALLLPRSTVYRSLNTLASHGIVRRGPDGSYTLGPGILALAAQVVVDAEERDLASLAQPHLARLSEATGEASKLSILAGDAALVVAVAQGGRSNSLVTVAGERFPLHAGAASKLLLAHLPMAEIERLLAQPLPALTPRTFADQAALLAELALIREQGWAFDRGEYSASVHALAAPVRDQAGSVVAALSIPFLADTDPVQRSRIRDHLLAAAAAISAALGASP